jgi:hypothetical protein
VAAGRRGFDLQPMAPHQGPRTTGVTRNVYAKWQML